MFHEGEAERIGDGVGSDAMNALARVVEERSPELVALFYRVFLAHEEASAFLSHSAVSERLSHSLSDWLGDLLRTDLTDEDFAARQKHIGEIHARIKIPIHLVLEGASLLKSACARHLVASGDLEAAELAGALIFLDERIDLAMRLMSEAYVAGTRRRVQTDEAYRLFALDQDVGVERESQRAALMEWSQNVLFALFGDGRDIALKSISASPFGLWLRHRAGMIFQDAGALDGIERTIREIDGVLLAKLRDARANASPELPRLIERLQSAVEEIKFLLADLFQAAAGLENGRDPLTRTLNRRFMPSILAREVTLASVDGGETPPFCLLMIDIDHFKRINDAGGHSAGDLVLRQVADIILDSVRPSDFVFRYGGEEFLVALVETQGEDALALAETIRTRLSAGELRLPNGGTMRVTASIGLAVFDGHPDYAYLLEAADRALYRAKEKGRDRVEVAAPPR